MPKALNKTKTDLRAQMRRLVAAMSDDERHHASLRACSNLIGLTAFARSSVIMLYMPLAGEVDITWVALRCFQFGQTICVPKVDWEHREMYPVEITSLDDRVMDTDEHGIRVPQNSRLIWPGVIDLVVAPGLAYDRHGNRLGRGGGYYDRFLTRLKRGATTAGLVFDRQVIDDVPATDRDIAVDLVVTDQQIISVRSSNGRASG